MGDYSRLEYRRAGNILAVRPLLRLLGPWDGADDPPAEALEFRDQLRQLLGAEAGPLLLDLRGFEYVRNWNWFLMPLARDCRGQGRPLAAGGRRAVRGHQARPPAPGPHGVRGGGRRTESRGGTA